jgi:diaminobutyrate-2-oxoglutarate transaminase
MNVLDHFESVAQSYVRTAPVVFDRARGSELFDENGSRYIDFHSAGGSLSYGHNNARVRSALLEYMREDRILQTSDRASVAKRRFVEEFVTTVLRPRNLNYRMLFTDPANGTSAEVALRLARRHKKRLNVIAFTNASHGMTEGALSITGKKPSIYESLDLRSNTVFMPFCDYLGKGVDTIAYLRRFLEDSASGIDCPAAVIVETVQVHGGLQVASVEWLRALDQLCRDLGILLIVDETTTGCGRTGPYFSFERAGVTPDIVLVSNAIAGGLPMSVLLLRHELDHWRPGEQVGIFQGDNLAFVAATELLSQWNDGFVHQAARHGDLLASELASLSASFPKRPLRVRGVGMVWALDFGRPGAAAVVSAWALERGLIVEPARTRDEVLLVQPPLNIEEAVLRDGLERLKAATSMFLSHS